MRIWKRKAILLLFDFPASAVDKWPAVLLFSLLAVIPSCWMHYRLSYWRRCINGRRGSCRFVIVIFEKDTKQLFMVLYCWRRLLSVLFLKIAFPRYQIMELWQVVLFWFFHIDRTILDSFHLLLLLVTHLKLRLLILLGYLSFFRGVLF